MPVWADSSLASSPRLRNSSASQTFRTVSRVRVIKFALRWWMNRAQSRIEVRGDVVFGVEESFSKCLPHLPHLPQSKLSQLWKNGGTSDFKAATNLPHLPQMPRQGQARSECGAVGRMGHVEDGSGAPMFVSRGVGVEFEGRLVILSGIMWLSQLLGGRWDEGALVGKVEHYA